MVDRQLPASRPKEKPFAFRSTIYTIAFLLAILGVLPSIFFLVDHWLSSSAETVATIWFFWEGFRSLVGIGVFTIGLGAYVFCSVWLIFFGRGPHVEFDPPKVFVATGPYQWVRNPVVITLITTVLGEAIYFGSVGILLLVLLGFPFAHYQVTRIEEPRLRERFGQSYIDYCGRVSRWIPKPPRGDSGD